MVAKNKYEDGKAEMNQNVQNGYTAGSRPHYTGKVQTGMGEDRQNVGKIAIWNNENPTSDKSPLQTGTVTIEIPEINATRTYRISIWKNVPKEE